MIFIASLEKIFLGNRDVPGTSPGIGDMYGAYGVMLQLTWPPHISEVL
jgi:hypothetical protein